MRQCAVNIRRRLTIQSSLRYRPRESKDIRRRVSEPVIGVQALDHLDCNGFVRLAMRDVEAEGVINAYEPIFPTVGEALESLATMIGEAPDVSRMARFGMN